MIPDSVLSSESLTASATVLYAAILVWNPGDGSGCSLGLKRIAQLLGKSEKTVKRRLKELKDAGLVTVKMSRSGPQRANICSTGSRQVRCDLSRQLRCDLSRQVRSDLSLHYNRRLRNRRLRNRQHTSRMRAVTMFFVTATKQKRSGIYTAS